jgi:hypothetical protein
MYPLVSPDSHFDIHVRTQAVDDGYEAICGKSIQFGISDARKIRCGYTCAKVGGAHGKLVFVQYLQDFGSKNGLELIEIGIRLLEITEDISTAAHQLRSRSIHRRVSFSHFNLCIAAALIHETGRVFLMLDDDRMLSYLTTVVNHHAGFLAPYPDMFRTR